MSGEVAIELELPPFSIALDGLVGARIEEAVKVIAKANRKTVRPAIILQAFSSSVLVAFVCRISLREGEGRLLDLL